MCLSESNNLRKPQSGSQKIWAMGSSGSETSVPTGIWPGAKVSAKWESLSASSPQEQTSQTPDGELNKGATENTLSRPQMDST